MKYRALVPFLAYGKAPQPGESVELTEEQARVLLELNAVAPYETKVKPAPQNKAKVGKKTTKKSESSRPARAQKKVTRKNSKKSAKK